LQPAVDAASTTDTPILLRWIRYRIAIVAAYVGLITVIFALNGLPARPYDLLWLLGLVVLTCAGSERAAARFLMDWLPLLVIAAGYDLVRSRAPDLIDRAVVEPQLRFDEILFGGTAPTVRLQDALVDGGTPHWWDYLAFLVYLSHFVFTLTVAVVLYLRNRALFRRLAILICTVSVAGFVTYFLLPAVPPWLASRYGDLQHTTRIVHAVWSDLGLMGPAKAFHGDARYANPVAALPSLHAAWPFMVLLLLWRRVGRWRWAILAYNAVMILTLVYGSEHYVSDILVGWLYAGVTFVVVNRVLDAGDRRRGLAAPSPP
jgi:membrane-associated phospholipid phosphatase